MTFTLSGLTGSGVAGSAFASACYKIERFVLSLYLFMEALSDETINTKLSQFKHYSLMHDEDASKKNLSSSNTWTSEAATTNKDN